MAPPGISTGSMLAAKNGTAASSARVVQFPLCVFEGVLLGFCFRSFLVGTALFASWGGVRFVSVFCAKQHYGVSVMPVRFVIETA